MTTVDITPAEVREVLKGKKVLIIGDSISRGIYKDLGCLLYGNNRLLTNDELRFNRCNHNKFLLFGEVVDSFKIDRSTSVNNVEKRKITSAEHDYYLFYSFCSRVWNKSIEQLLSTIKEFDVVFIQSLIWDLSKYSDQNGEQYLRNLDTCLTNLMNLNRNIIWIFLPAPISHHSFVLNNLIAKMYAPTMDIVNRSGCKSLDFRQLLKNNSDIRNYDGIHFSPYGHRLISSFLIGFLRDLCQEIAPEPINNSSSNDQCSIALNHGPNDTHAASKEQENHGARGREVSRAPPKNFYDKTGRSRAPRRFLRKCTAEPGATSSRSIGANYHPYYNSFKTNTSNVDDAEAFGRAFGTAWKTFHHF